MGRYIYTLSVMGVTAQGLECGFDMGLPNPKHYHSPESWWYVVGFIVDYAQEQLVERGCPVESLTWTVWTFNLDHLREDD